MKKKNGQGSLRTVKRKNGDYYIGTITLGFNEATGKQERKTFGSYNQREVINKMNEAKYLATNNIYNPSDISFSDYFYDWIHIFKKPYVSSGTFRRYDTGYRMRIQNSNIANIRVKDLNLSRLQKYFNDLKGTYSNYIIKETKQMISSCLETAVDDNLIIKNPCKGVIIDTYIPENNYKVFSPAQQESIIKYLDFENTLDLAIYIDFCTGLRLGELCALEWSDLINDELHIQRQYKRKYFYKNDGSRSSKLAIGELKTHSSKRTIPLPSLAIKKLKLHQNNQLRLKSLLKDDYNENNLILCDDLGNYFDKKRIPRRLNKICRELDIPEMGIHVVRHTYATRLFEKGVPVKIVQKLLGHRDYQTTMNIYVHVMPENKKEAIKKLESVLSY